MREDIGLVSRGVTVLAAMLAVVGRVAGHGGHSGHATSGGQDVALVTAVVGGSLLVLGTSVYLDHNGALDGKWADTGVLLGVVGLLAGMTLAIV